MHFSSSEDESAVSRIATLALVGFLFVSAVGGSVGTTGIAAAQAGGPGGNTSAGNASASAGAGSSPGGGANNSTAGNPVQATIQEFKQNNLGYSKLSPEKKKEVRTALRELQAKRGNLNKKQEDKLIVKVKRTVLYQDKVGPIPMDQKPEQQKQVEDIIEKHLGAEGGFATTGSPNSPGFDIDIPGMLEAKIKAFADEMRKGAASILKKVYGLAFSTKVPQNDGWEGILGTPTNEPFKPLHEQLLQNKLYPLLNYLLGTAVILMGLSLVVNPLMSRFRALDLFIKFASFLLLYVSAWAIVTIMHGVVDDITIWLRPSEQAMGALATNVTKLSAGAVGAYFVGAGGILTSVFGLGLELGLRRVALQYFFPYIFPVLLLLLYASPWRRLKSLASVVLWQYVNVLTMVIPMALLLKAAAVVSFSTSSGVVSMLVLVALFLFAVSIPGITTYTFLQVPGTAARAGYSAAAGAAAYAGTAKEKLGWGGEDSASSGSATGDSSPGVRTEQAVEASTDGGTTGIPNSGELSHEQVEQMDSTGGSTTTAGQVRELEQSKNRDPMNPSAMKESYFEDHPQRTTMQEKLANKS